MVPMVKRDGGAGDILGRGEYGHSCVYQPDLQRQLCTQISTICPRLGTTEILFSNATSETKGIGNLHGQDRL